MKSEAPALPVLPDFSEVEDRRKIKTSGQESARKMPGGIFSEPQAHPERQSRRL